MRVVNWSLFLCIYILDEKITPDFVGQNRVTYLMQVRQLN